LKSLALKVPAQGSWPLWRGVHERLSLPAPLGSNPYTVAEALVDAKIGLRLPGIRDIGARMGDGLRCAPSGWLGKAAWLSAKYL